MADKPSLYVVEKKEVVILIILFVLITVLAFTMGVKYGEKVGHKAAVVEDEAAQELRAENKEAAGGTLGGASASKDGEEAHGQKGSGAIDQHGAKEPGSKAHGAAGHSSAEKGKSGSDDSNPEAAARALPASENEGLDSGSKVAVDRNSDQYLLSALKQEGIEPPGGSSPKAETLPQDVKRVRPGTFVIQVGSHPTRAEAETQLRALKARKVAAEILTPFKDRQGEWHRVVIPGFKAKKEAEKEATALRSSGAVSSFFVWRLP
jgi:cell division septation protein DedD